MGVVYPELPHEVFNPEIVNADLERTFLGAPLPTNYTSQALEKSRVVFTGQCRLTSITVHSTLGAAQYIMIFDAPALPADSTICGIVLPVGANGTAQFSWGQAGRWMQFGLTICNSTTDSSKTLGAANTVFDVQYTPLVI